MTAETGSKKFLWIGWDGADWEHIMPMLDQGLLPNLEKMINEGVMGNLASLQPILSPMLWNSAATGKFPYKHGIYGFTEPDFKNGGARPYSSYSRKCKAVWNIFSQLGLKSNVINWWASHPAEQINGCVVSNLFQGTKLVDGKFQTARNVFHPLETAEKYVRNKVFPTELTSEQLCAFVPLADNINQAEDSRLETVANVISECLTTHAVGTEIMANEPWDFMALYYTAIDHFSHAFMQYHPPRQDHIDEEDFEIFKDVVTGCYRFSDMMLGRIMSLCNDDTTILLCSDHGFHSREGRPKANAREPAGPAIWHRQYGMIVMKGPNIKKDEIIHGSSLIDIAPTILVAMGLPVGEDMDGRPLIEVFEDPPEIEYIPSWEDVEGEFPDGMFEGEPDIKPEEAQALLEQFIALGYIDDPGDDKEKQQNDAHREARYNYARSLVFASRPKKALPIFNELCHESPWETRFIVQWIVACSQAGMNAQVEKLIEAAFDLENTEFQHIRVLWCESQLALNKNREKVFEILKDVELKSKQSGILNRIGKIFRGMNKLEDAERLFKGAIEKNSEDAEALNGLASVYCKQGRNQETIDTALECVSLIHRKPLAHYHLGRALARTGEIDKAIFAFETAIKFSPMMTNAHRMLGRLYKMKNEDDKAAHHREQVQELQEQTVDRREKKLATSRDVTFDIPDFGTKEWRLEQLDIHRPLRKDPRRPSGKTFVLVSGLPRSGTSMMMQMLEAGGLNPKTDGERVADIDNPKGYYEWEMIKKVANEPEIMDEEGLEDKAIKAISMLLPKMPYSHEYRVIFLTRPLPEVVASQSKMIERLETEGAKLTDEELMQTLRKHRAESMGWLNQNQRVEFLEIDYPSLVKDPQKYVDQIVEFLGPERLPNADQMAAVVDSKLYRQKVDDIVKAPTGNNS